MERETQKHIEEERLEAYAMDSLAGDEFADVEEHLLFCATCQDQLQVVEGYTQAMRSAANRIRNEEREASAVPGAWQRLRSLLHVPLPIWCGAVAMAVLIIIVSLQFRQRPGTPVDVELQAVRGASTTTAQAGHTLRLRLDNHGVPELPDWRIEIVNPAGSMVWTGTGIWTDTAVKATVPISFAPGTYYVRLRKVVGDPIREYELVVQ